MTESVTTTTADTPMRVSRNDLPWLARTASDAARGGQRWYVRLVGTDLRLLILASLVSAVEWPDETVRRASAVAAAGFLAFGLVLTALTQQERRGRDWIAGRAVAEAVKTHAWRYMTRAAPYEGRGDADAIDRAFVTDLWDILHNHKGFARIIGGKDDAIEQITSVMRQVRALDTAERAAVYLRDRLAPQQEYYRANAAANQRSQQQWFMIVIAGQALGLIAAIAKAVWMWLPISLAGVFATVAAAALAWMQLKQYQDLAQAYGLAAHELALLRAQADFVQSDGELSAFVADAEAVMSREHGQWVARRDRD